MVNRSNSPLVSAFRQAINNMRISGNSHIINSLPEGRYQWRVRSVDHSLSFSDWSDWDYFYIDQTPPTVNEIQVNYGVGGQIIIIVNFKEEFEMNNSLNAEPAQHSKSYSFQILL